jgi:hypothetical protein
MNDTELAALTTLVNVDGMQMDADNRQAERAGVALPWAGSIKWPERDALEAELKRREVI